MELNIINTANKIDKNEYKSILCTYKDTIADIKKQISKNLKIDLSNDRMGLYYEDKNTHKNIYLFKNDKILKECGVDGNTTLYVKDLGPQISWRLTYVLEYIGPLLIFIYFFIKLEPVYANFTQLVGFAMSTIHFTKRIIESLFVHVFSNKNMRLMNLFKNCFYYWIIYGICCGYSLFRHDYDEPFYSPVIRGLFIFLFVAAEYMNMKCHLVLKRLKEENKGEKGIPDGYGFELVSCANYFWELVSWLSYSMFVNLPAFYIFTLIGFLIMRGWAIKKHNYYMRVFGDRYPTNRKAFIPFLI
jgi:very-long-chain enoyl-CoA reductase